MGLKRILVPVDFSAQSLAALKYAVQFAHPAKPEIMVVHVIDVLSLVHPSELSVALPDTVIAEVERGARAELNRIAADMRRKHVKVRTILEIGSPARTIVDLAKKSKTDLIVMSTHGRTGFSHMFLGSVAERVVRMASCPVLTVRGKAPLKRRTTKPLARAA